MWWPSSKKACDDASEEAESEEEAEIEAESEIEEEEAESEIEEGAEEEAEEEESIENSAVVVDAADAARQEFLSWTKSENGFFASLSGLSPCRMDIIADVMAVHRFSAAENALFSEDFRQDFIHFLKSTQPADRSNWFFSLNVFQSRFLETLLALGDAPSERKLWFFVESRKILFAQCVKEGTWPVFMDAHVLRLFNRMMGFS